METTLYLYTVARKLPTGDILNGLPFVAMNDQAAKQMVVDSLGKDIDKIELEAYELRSIGRYCPDREQPLVKLCESSRVKISVADIVAELVKTPVEVGDVNE